MEKKACHESLQRDPGHGSGQKAVPFGENQPIHEVRRDKPEDELQIPRINKERESEKEHSHGCRKSKFGGGKEHEEEKHSKNDHALESISIGFSRKSHAGGELQRNPDPEPRCEESEKEISVEITQPYETTSLDDSDDILGKPNECLNENHQEEQFQSGDLPAGLFGRPGFSHSTKGDDCQNQCNRKEHVEAPDREKEKGCVELKKIISHE